MDDQKKTILGWYQPPGVQPTAGQPGSPPAPVAQPAPGYAQPAHGAQPGQPPQGYAPQGYDPSQGYGQHGYGQPPQAYGQPAPNAQSPYATPQQPYGAAPQQQPYGAQPYGTPAPGQPFAGAQQPYAQQPYAAAPQPYPQAPSSWQPPVAPQPFSAPSEAADSSSDLRGTANATAGQSERLRFIRLTYAHLLGAILTFAGLLYLLMTNEFLIRKVSAPLAIFALDGRFHWAIVLAVFMAVSWVADYWARHTTSRAMQYVGLGIYVIAEALIFVPLLVIVMIKTEAIIARGGGNPNILRDAAITTLALFGALTASVFISKKDFSFLRSGLMLASGAALTLVALSLVFGFNLGIVFSIAMVLLAAGYILFQTSQILAHYDPRNYVAASLALFSSVALMFWYVIRIFLRMRD
ncbi:MAG: hypothetical protein HOV80_34000 [Polyangiaceae bacterium]|nr:hypothetical protein [Polyangiaceae bacterium]